MPAASPASNNNKIKPAPTIASLNFRYLPSLGGESEPCGKYGGGLSVAITAYSFKFSLNARAAAAFPELPQSCPASFLLPLFASSADLPGISEPS